ncbi:MAG TPA: TrbG/VirB9 family P-type conjugative transfer protein [Acidobacteriaceae bacterium]
MKHCKALGLIFAALAAHAQSVNYSQVQHVHTALNHLSILETGEPVTSFALADPDAFSIQQDPTRIFIKPTHDKRATNLFVFTATRKLAFELDPAGDVATMNVVLDDLPPVPARSATGAATTANTQEPSDEGVETVAGLVLTQALLGTSDIAHDGVKVQDGHVGVTLEQVLRAKNVTYIRYEVENRTNHAFRVTTPDVTTLVPTQTPVSLLGLKNHQLRSSETDVFKAKRGNTLSVLTADGSGKDLAPGQKMTGVISVRDAAQNPSQIYELSFGTDNAKPITVEAVL